MNGNIFIGLLATLWVTIAPCAEAQQTEKISRIAFLGGSTAAALAKRLEAFRQGLHELGYAEGKNILIEYRYAEGQPRRLPALAAKLVQSKIDVIVTGGPFSSHAARDEPAKFPLSWRSTMIRSVMASL